LNELNVIIQRITDDLEKYQFSDAALAFYEFFWHTFCDWYIEISKIELNKTGSPYRNIVQNVLAHALKESLILMHVMTPFITEEIYQGLPVTEKKESIMLETWPEYKEKFRYDPGGMAALQEIIYIIRNLRGDLEISPAEKIDVCVETKNTDLLHDNEEMVKSLAKVNAFITEKKRGFIGREIKDSKGKKTGEAGMNAEQIKEPARVLKNKQEALKKLENGVKITGDKMENENFMKHATEKVVAEEKEKLVRLTLDCENLRALIKVLENL
jgi:valyl-tRNA synthetase